MSYIITSPVTFDGTSTITVGTGVTQVDFSGASGVTIHDFVDSAQGSFFYVGAAGNVADLAPPGTANQFLVFNTASTAPEWTVVPGAGGGFGVSKSGTQAIANGAAFVPVTGWSEVAPDFDIGGNFVSGTGLFTVPATGRYDLMAKAEWAETTTINVGQRSLRLRLNPGGTSPEVLIDSIQQPNPNTAILNHVYSVIKRAQLTLADEVGMEVQQDSGNSANIAAGVGTTFSAQQFT